MKNKNLANNLFGLGAIGCAIYCLTVCIILRSGLTTDLKELPPYLEAIGIIFLPALLTVGLFHIYLLANMLKNLAGRFLNSLYVVLLILSGILLFSDITLLSDIGKEYRLWNVSSQWHMLFLFLAFHIFIVTAGYILLRRNTAQTKPSVQETDNEAFFLSMHQIALISGILGLCGVFYAMSGAAVPLRFSTQFMGLLAILALFPLAFILIYWRLRFKKNGKQNRMDEKQFSDTASASLICLLIAIAFYIAICILDLGAGLSLPVSFFIFILFFLQLAVFSSVILIKNK